MPSQRADHTGIDEEFKPTDHVDTFRTIKQRRSSMKWKKKSLRELAHMICGDDKEVGASFFRFRSSMYVTGFFEECGLDFVHDGSTAWAWVSRRLEEVLAFPHSEPSVLPDAFIKIIRTVLNRREAQNNDPHRCKALAALNKVLAREGWEAFYDEQDVAQLRHVLTNGVAPLSKDTKPSLGKCRNLKE